MRKKEGTRIEIRRRRKDQCTGQMVPSCKHSPTYIPIRRLRNLCKQHAEHRHHLVGCDSFILYHHEVQEILMISDIDVVAFGHDLDLGLNLDIAAEG